MKNALKFLVSITIFFASSVAYTQNSASAQEIMEVESLVNPSQESNNNENNEETESNPNETKDNTNTENLNSELTPEELEKYEKFLEADRLYLEGKIVAAEKLYREVLSQK